MSPRSTALFVAALLAATAATAADVELPRRKSGLWEVASGLEGRPPAVSQVCVDEKVDDATRQMSQGVATCSKQEMRREGDRYLSDSVCTFGETTATTRAVFSGKFDSAYEVDIRARYEPPLGGMSEGHTVIRARWLGACKPGQRPGDMTLPNGMTVNIYDAGKAAPKR